MKKRKKTVTLDKLATMVAEGFSETATKKDIADMATKQDLTRMATKHDIANMATKQDLADTATKQDTKKINARIDDLAERIGRVESKLDRALYKEVARLESLVHQLANKMHVKLEY